MGEDEESEDPRAFPNQSFWKKLIILCAGSFMNFLLGVILIVLMYVNAGAFMSPVIDSFMDGCPYAGDGAFEEGDRFYSIDGHRIYLFSDVSMFLERGDGVYDIVVVRDGEKVELDNMKLVPALQTDEGMKYGLVWGVEEATFGAKLRYTWNTTLEFSRLVWLGLGDLINGAVGMDEMAGPVGIVDMMNDVGSQAESTADAVYSMLYFSAFIAINLAIMNMLPIPALDGGRIFFLMVDGVALLLFKRRVPEKYQAAVNAAGFVVLMGFMLLVTFQDVFKLFR